MLEDQLLSDYKKAMIEKDSAKSSTISFLRSQIKYALIEKKVEKLADADVAVVIKKQVKQRQDSIEQFEKGGRTDLVEKEKRELDILKSYLPKEMSDDDLRGIIKASIAEAGAASVQDMGKLMKVVMAKTAGQADNKRVSDLVKEALSQL